MLVSWPGTRVWIVDNWRRVSIYVKIGEIKPPVAPEWRWRTNEDFEIHWDLFGKSGRFRACRLFASEVHLWGRALLYGGKYTDRTVIGWHTKLMHVGFLHRNQECCETYAGRMSWMCKWWENRASFNWKAIELNFDSGDEWERPFLLQSLTIFKQ